MLRKRVVKFAQRGIAGNAFFDLGMQYVRRLFVVKAHHNIVVYQALDGHVLHAVHCADSVCQSVEILHIVGHAFALARHGYGH